MYRPPPDPHNKHSNIQYQFIFILPSTQTLTTNTVTLSISSSLYCTPQTIQHQFLSLCRLLQLAMPSRLTVVLLSLLLATPAVVFWLWLVIVPAKVEILCPEGCRCDTGGYFVECDGTSLKSVPLIHLTDVRVLGLFSNEITSLENDSFFSLTELDRLYIPKCGLRTINLGAFNGLTKLT